MWLVLSLVAALGFAFAKVLFKKGYDNVSPAQTYFIDSLGAFTIWVPYVTLNRADLDFSKSFLVFGYALAVMLLFILPIVAWERGKLSLTGTIASSSPIFTLILAYIFLRERISLHQTVLISTVILGVLLIGMPSNLKKALQETKREPWFFWGLLAASADGLLDFIARPAVLISGVTTYLLLGVVAQLLVGSLWLCLSSSYFLEFMQLPRYKLLPTVLGTLSLNIGAVAFYEAVARERISLIAPVVSSNLALVVVFAHLFLHEKINVRQWLGIIIVSIGIILLGVF